MNQEGITRVPLLHRGVFNSLAAAAAAAASSQFYFDRSRSRFLPYQHDETDKEGISCRVPDKNDDMLINLYKLKNAQPF